jgi:hypothetical protein
MDRVSVHSEYVFISSSVYNIDIQSNKNINTYAGGSITYQTGDPNNIENAFTINSQNIILGLQANPTITLESTVKSDQLINVLNQMLSIMSDIATNPGESKYITEEITLLSQQLNKIKSQTTKTY